MAERVIGGSPKQDDPDAIRVLDPHLDQARDPLLAPR